MTTPAGSIFVQLQTSLEAAIVTAGTVYQSFGLLHRTSALDVKHEFATIVATLDQAIATMEVFPTDRSSGSQVLDIAPKGIAIFTAIARTTAALKSLSTQVSKEDGIALLNSYKEVESKISVLIVTAKPRFASLHHGVPGVTELGLTRIRNLFLGLEQALSSVLPPSISANEVQTIHASIIAIIDDSASSFGLQLS